MNDQTDLLLLRAYAEHRSEAAFAELVRRHVDFVYSAARRMVCDSHLAQDVTQSVFVALAKNAGQLSDRSVLSGWLHRTAQNIAAQTVRTDVRRRAREQEAVAMNELLAHESDAAWENIAPHLDTALGELSEPDRDALLLRYFERKSAREMAQTLGTSEEAAQKRVSRAVERLRELFSKRNVTVGASGLVVLISTNAVQAAPIGLIAIISSAVSLAGTALQTSTAIAATKTIAMTTLQKTLIANALGLVAVLGIFEAKHVSTLRHQIETLKKEKLQMTEQVQRLQPFLKNISPPNTANAQVEKLEEQFKKSQSELLQLRSRVGRSGAERSEAARMRAELDALSNGPPVGVMEKDGTLKWFNPATNEWARSANKQKHDQTKSRELEKLSQLKRKLNLSSEQEAAIENLVLQAVENKTKPRTASTLAELAALGNEDKNLENQIRQTLLPEQLSDYDDLLQGRLFAQARFDAILEVNNLQSLLGLSVKRQEEAFEIIFQGKMQPDLTRPSTIGRQELLNRRLKPLESVLSPSEIEIYRKQLEKPYVGNK